MSKSLLLSSLAAAALAFGVVACEEQQATDSTAEPMQQQGAMPNDDSTGTPVMPESSEPQATEPYATVPDTTEPEAEQPAGSQ